MGVDGEEGGKHCDGDGGVSKDEGDLEILQIIPPSCLDIQVNENVGSRKVLLNLSPQL